MLRVLHEIPDGLTDLPARSLHRRLGGPTLIRVASPRAAAPVFVSVLLHGNETTGWEALRVLLRTWRDAPPPTPVDVFLGNVEAAGQARRHLDHQPDFNRIWAQETGAEGALAQALLSLLAARPPRLALDVHNTSGRNPPYACCHRLGPEHLALARSFGETVVYVDRPAGMLGVALSALAPAVTLECGRPGDPTMEARVAEYLGQVVEDRLPPPAPSHQPPMLRCAAVLRVPASCRFGFGEGVDLQLLPRLDRYNFSHVAAGTPLARVRPGSDARLAVLDASGEDVWRRYLSLEDGWIRARVPLLPSLITLDERIIRQDCLGYLMEPLPLQDAASG